MVHTEKILLILDLDETLIHARTEPLERPADFKVFDYHVYKRPYLEAFLKNVTTHFQLAVWSSASDDYVEEVVNSIFVNKEDLVFVWGRSRCTYTRNYQIDDYGYYQVDNGSHYHYTKRLQKLKRKDFDLKRMLIVDDTPHKCRHNYGNAIYPKAYEGAIVDEELLHLASYLLSLEKLDNVRRVEKRNWRFG